MNPRVAVPALTAAFLALGIAFVDMTARAQGNQESKSVWDGVYTADQAKRGQTVYGEECARCHSESLMGGESSPALAGNAFLEHWNGQTVGDLFERVRTTMPADSPGRLSRSQYLETVAYILSANKFPAGQKELQRDEAALKIKIESKK